LIKQYAKYFDEKERELFQNILDSNYTSCILFLDSIPHYHDYQLIAQEIGLYLTRNWKNSSQMNRHKDFQHLVSHCISNEQFRVFEKWMGVEMDLYENDPTYNIFAHMHIIDDRLGLIQDNGYDCGYYVMPNFKEFVRLCVSMGLENLLSSDKTFRKWFSYDDIVNQKRSLMERLLREVPKALKDEDQVHLADIWTYLCPEYDAVRKRGRDNVMEGLTTLLAKRQKAALKMKELELELDKYCQTNVPKLYSSRQTCENDRSTIQKAVDASYCSDEMDIEGGVEKTFREILNKSFPELIGKNEEMQAQSSSAFLSQSSSVIFSQSSIASESTYTPSPDSTVNKPFKPRAIPTRNSKNTKTVAKNSQIDKEDEAISKQAQLSNYTEEFISQHRQPLFTLFYPTKKHAESSVPSGTLVSTSISENSQRSTNLRDHKRSESSSATVGAAIAAVLSDESVLSTAADAVIAEGVSRESALSTAAGATIAEGVSRKSALSTAEGSTAIAGEVSRESALYIA
jgi:hypothetical protein